MIKKAFTLVEILITLTIIGIIAVMTMQNLIINAQKEQYVSALKKAYLQINQALQQIALENGNPDTLKEFFGTSKKAGDALSSKLKTISNCGTTAGEECFVKFDNNYDGSANSTFSWTNGVNSGYKFVTMDGMSVSVRSYNSNCTSDFGFPAAPDAPTYNSMCGELFIDVNGTKGPNYFGRDVFLFFITSNKRPLLYPRGGFYCSNNDTGTLTGGGNEYWNFNGMGTGCSPGDKYGGFCAGRVMEKSWTMDY